jgi:hypothetical protein
VESVDACTDWGLTAGGKVSIDLLLIDFNGNPGVKPDALQEFERVSGILLPEDYRAILRRCDGGEGFIGDGSYLILWRISELLTFNKEYEVHDYCPGLLLFGSNGSGDAFGFDLRLDPFQIVRVPFVGMAEDEIVHLTSSFMGFLEILSREE